jgi:hypothetical protein
MACSDHIAELLLYIGILLAVVAAVVVILMALGIVSIEHTTARG